MSTVEGSNKSRGVNSWRFNQQEFINASSSNLSRLNILDHFYSIKQGPDSPIGSEGSNETVRPTTVFEVQEGVNYPIYKRRNK